MDRFAYLNTMDNSVIEELFQRYKNDPGSVDESWRKFFEGFEFCQKNYKAEAGEAFLYPGEFNVMNLIMAYRQRGHLFTRTNPVRTRRKYTPTLDPENFGLTSDDLSRTYQAGKEVGLGNARLSDILVHLKQTYCQSVGVEYYHLRRPERVSWLQRKMESCRNTPSFAVAEKEGILRKLAEAVLMEKFIHKKFPGHKSFSLEGVESLIPALDAVIHKGVEMGTSDFVIAMAHRGRLNVLANIMHKPFPQIFSEFEGKEYSDEELLGDVKYHLGYSAGTETRDGREVYLILCPNPSHLEAVDPVVEGIARARIEHLYRDDFSKALPVLIHGDASISGQGIIYEILQMADLEGYKTGGTVHLVVNNQLGFTTNYTEGRSSIYCTDVAKTIQAPIFHVNADDVEAVVYTVILAMEYRAEFGSDVFIDLLGYRKYGHNESDEPRFTQPVLYKIIETHPDPLDIYVRKLEEEKLLSSLPLEAIKSGITDSLEKGYEASKRIEKADIAPFLGSIWKGKRSAKAVDFESSPDTAIDESVLVEMGMKITSLPEGIPFFRKVVKLQQDRREMLGRPGFSPAGRNGQLDWAMGELLAYGSLLREGHPVRLSGQDSQRGTFSHRHAALTIEDSEEKYIPLQHLSENQARFSIINSLLSEYGVLGFEYGYSLATPDGLTLWEAQFGDFSNGAQVIIDQYICSAEDKWRIMNGLVMLLPHGYEGQGPEHSSARLERFLSICSHDNIQIVNCTTPANFFHLLRRQIHRPFRKPLVVFTPKSLLRHPACVSLPGDFTRGGFREIIDDPHPEPEKVQRVVLCSGKVYYDILEEKEKQHVTDVALVRLEQLYPLSVRQLKEIHKRYPSARQWEWVQEEPVNMGAWPFLSLNLPSFHLYHTARPASGSPATGSSRLHKLQQKLIVDKAIGKCTCKHANGTCLLQCAEHENQII